MALSGIQFSGPILVGLNQPVDVKYGPYATTAVALAEIPLTLRHIGLTVAINDTATGLKEYWFKSGTANSDLVLKDSGGGSTYVHPTGDGNQHVPATGTTNNGRVLKAGSTAGDISWGTLSLSDITQSSATLNQVATWNGTSWVPQTPASGGGGVTSFSAGTTGLAPSTATSGAVTLSGTLALANGGTGATTAAAARTNLGVAATSHTHGNITNAGAIGTTAGLPIITGASGVLQAGSFGTTAGTFAQGNDPRIASSIVSVGTRTITDEQIMTEAEYAAITPNPTTLYFII